MQQADAKADRPANQAGQAKPAADRPRRLQIKIVDETGVAVSGAIVILTQTANGVSLKSESDITGRVEISAPAEGGYSLTVEKEGYYQATLNEVQAGKAEYLQLTLNHEQEYEGTVNVTDSPQAIDPGKTSQTESLTSQTIINVPYPSTHEFRNVLPLMPGVVQDTVGQIHINGSDTSQVQDQLDGFNITHPVSGLLNLHLSVDALREVQVQTSRESAEFGKGSGGVLTLNTGMGDDHFRYSATNFIPSVQSRGGFGVDEWTPRLTVSGPLMLGKAWFFNAADADYKNNVFPDLPAGANRSPFWQVSNLTKGQLDLTRTNILIGSFLYDRFDLQNNGLSEFTPFSTTTNQTQNAYVTSVKDLAYLAGGTLLETGAAFIKYQNTDLPKGDLPFVMTPTAASGNFFRTDQHTAERVQGIANLTLSEFTFQGRHELRFGADLDRITYNQLFDRRPITIENEAGAVLRQVTFVDAPQFTTHNTEMSGYAQDRWIVTNRFLLEAGVRFDHDTIIRQAVVSPRLAGTYMLRANTKLVAGYGRFYDETSLDFITRPFTGQRFDTFFSPAGAVLGPPLQTVFMVNQQNLKAPRFSNWSAGVEQRLPADIYLQVDYIERRGSNGLVFINEPAAQPGQFSGQYLLTNDRQDRYRGVEVTFKRLFKGNSAFLVSYTRSSARSNAVVDFNLDNPIFSQQGAGPLGTDAPNRVVAWGWTPLPLPKYKGFTLAYSVEWRTGYPFSVVNQEQELVGTPNSLRYPTYFSANMHIEKRFSALGFQWTVRAGFNDITGRPNPSVVGNNIDSPQFLTFGGLQHRAFTARIRFLGRAK